MSAQIKVNAELHMKEAGIVNEIFDQLPENPTPGLMVVVDGVPQTYTNIDGEYGWWVMSQKAMYYTHYQTDSSKQWVVDHNLGTDSLMVHVYNEDNQLIMCNITQVNDNTLYIDLTSATTGRAIIFGASQAYAGYVPESSIPIQNESIAYGTDEPTADEDASLYVVIE